MSSQTSAVPDFLLRAKAATVSAVTKHKKSCIIVVCLIVLVIVMLVVSAHMWPDSFVAGYVPAWTWTSPDFKLLKKNHTNKTRRSDNKVDTWSKADFLKSVTKFNDITAQVD